MRLSEYDHVVINSSAGKDSQTLLARIATMAKAEGYPRNRITVAHADLGRMEWPGTRELAEYQANCYGFRFWVRARTQGDLLHHILDRGMWPSSTERYCTSDHKRDQIAHLVRSLGEGKILNCLGMRAQESPARAKMLPFSVNKRVSTKTRHVDQWLAIHELTTAEVWEDIHSRAVPYHYAYDLGMPRLSCVFCIFSPPAALMVAGYHNSRLLAEYAQTEQAIDHTFRKGFRIGSIAERLNAGEQPPTVVSDWKM